MLPRSDIAAYEVLFIAEVSTLRASLVWSVSWSLTLQQTDRMELMEGDLDTTNDGDDDLGFRTPRSIRKLGDVNRSTAIGGGGEAGLPRTR